MNKVTSINIGGNAYQLEEGAYDALRRYLDDARLKLADNPDKEEIINDLEQAIGGKCNAFLSAHKTVITLGDIEQVLAQMGPVDAPDSARASSSQDVPYKRLFRLQEGKIIFGVCTGLAAYANIDVSLIRLLFIILTAVTGGGFIFAYVLMTVFIPEADTPQERAEAYGNKPITAQDLIDRAKKEYDQFKNSGQWKHWKHQMKDYHKQWKETHKATMKAQRHAYRYDYDYGRHYRPSAFWEFMQMVGGLAWLLFLGFVAWLGYHHIPPVKEFFDALYTLWNQFILALAQATH